MRERQTLSDLLRKTFKETAISKRAQARSDVALRIKEILEQSQHGWSLRAMWRVLKDNGEVACAYSTFVKHVQALRDSEPIAPPKNNKEFSWNPVPKKEDLISDRRFPRDP